MEGSQPLWFGRGIESLKKSGAKSSSALPIKSITPEEAAAQVDHPASLTSQRRNQWLLVGGGVAVVLAGLWLKRRFG